MDVKSDLIVNLLETPFHRWQEADKNELLNSTIDLRPTTELQVNIKVNRPSGKVFKVHFKNIWYNQYRWLCGSYYLNKLFCWPCIILGMKKNVWNSTGFNDFVNVTRSLHKHDDSAEHMKCVMRFKELKLNLNRITDVFQESSRLYISNYNENVRLNRLCMKTFIKGVLFLGKQELAFYTHDENVVSTNRDNFKELLSVFLAISSEEVKSQYEKIKNVFTADSKIIQNEIIECISRYVRDHIINEEIQNIPFFSVEVNDTTDITQTSQCSVILRYIKLDGTLVERFLGFHDVSDNQTADGIFETINDILEPFQYENKLVSQCFDGGIVMSGELYGLQMRMKETAPQAIFIQSLAHPLDLVLQQSFTKNISKCRIFFANLNGIPTFFQQSLKRSDVLISIFGKNILTANDTRWSSNANILETVLENWNGLKEVYEKITEDPNFDDTSICQAEGFLNNMNDFEFTLLALIFYSIFCTIEILFEDIHKKCFDMNLCSTSIQRSIETITSKRNCNYFNGLFCKAKEITPFSPRNLKKKYNSLSENKLFSGYEILYYEIIDTLVIEFNTRFQDIDKLLFVCLADTTKFTDYVKCFPTKALENLVASYPNIFKRKQRLKTELELLYRDENYHNIGVQNVTLLLRKNGLHEEVYVEVYRLFSLVLTLPSVSLSTGRNFSCLKRVKTYLRNTVTQQRLSSLAIISIERELLCELEQCTPFYDDITDRFSALKERRIDIIFKK